MDYRVIKEKEKGGRKYITIASGERFKSKPTGVDDECRNCFFVDRARCPIGATCQGIIWKKRKDKQKEPANE